jgi:hypothetical protein
VHFLGHGVVMDMHTIALVSITLWSVHFLGPPKRGGAYE